MSVPLPVDEGVVAPERFVAPEEPVLDALVPEEPEAVDAAVDDVLEVPAPVVEVVVAASVVPAVEAVDAAVDAVEAEVDEEESSPMM